MTDAPNKVRVLAVNAYPVGPTFSLHRDEDSRLEVRCTQGVLRAMLGHARKGLKSDKGGLMESEAVEVKGFLLGRVEQSGRRLVVIVERTVELPMHALDRGDAAYFTASDHVLLEHKLRKYDGGQLVGYYHSHPNHPVRLSEQDIQHFRENLTEPFQLAAIVGPAESVTGFFLQREMGGYEPNQEAEFTVDYDDDGMPVVETVFRENGFDDPVAPPPPPRARKQSWGRLLALAAVLIAVAVAAVLFIHDGTSRPEVIPVLRLSDYSLELDPLKPQHTISLSLDTAGACDFTVRAEGNVDWLDVVPLQGEIVHPRKTEITVTADMGRIAPGDSLMSHVIVVAVPRVEGAETQTTTIPVKGRKNTRIVEQQSTWRVADPTVGYDGITWNLDDCPLTGDEVRKTVVLSVREGSEETTVFTREVVGSRLRVASGELPSLLDWSSIRLEARAEQVTEQPDQIISISYIGTATLAKQVVDWDLPSPELTGGTLGFVTLPLRTVAHWSVEVDEGSGWRRVNRGVLEAGQSITHTREYDPEVRELRIRAAFVGDGGIFEYRYVYPFSRVDGRDVVFDRSQGPAGRSFRAEYADLYAAADLSLLGEIGGPRHYADLDDAGKAGCVLLSKNKSVHAGSWERLNAIGEELTAAGHGRFGWIFDHGSNLVVLVFVMPDEAFKAHCDALVAYAEIRELVADSPNGRLSIRPPDIENEDAFNLGSYRLPRDGGGR